MEKIVKLSKSQPTLKTSSISEFDVLLIWDALSYVIREELSKRKGVVIPGFGTFTFVEQRLDIGTNNTQLVKMKPFFLLSDKFAQLHSVDYEKEYINSSIPVSRINYVAINELTKRKYSRDVVEIVLNEAFTALDHFIRQDGEISIPFNGLGVFSVSEMNPKPKKIATFKFYTDILSQLPNN